jgi:hypothetical protein
MILQTIASSWPIAVMFIALLIFIFATRFFGWIKKQDREDKAYRASQAVAVQDRGHRTRQEQEG